MTKSLEDYSKYLAPVPASLPGLYRWKVVVEGYPYLHLQVWECDRTWFLRKEKTTGHWKTVKREQMYSAWTGTEVTVTSESIVRHMRIQYDDTNIVMAERV